MISDGWGYNQIDSASYYIYGRAGGQEYTHFPFQIAMSTYDLNNLEDNCLPQGYDPDLAWSDFDLIQYPCATDSAAAVTAMSTGLKTYAGRVSAWMQTDNHCGHHAGSRIEGKIHRRGHLGRIQTTPRQPVSWLIISAGTTTKKSLSR